jgi:cell division cycle 20-like protein 1 (cofactor of APC complex)
MRISLTYGILGSTVIRSTPLQTYTEHKAAVRALAWSPHNYGTLYSGGGYNDKCIKIWNINSESSTSTIQTDSQICNMLFCKHSNEFVTTHGFSKNQIMIWNADKKERIAVLDGHSTRVLHLALSPDGESIATASGDETLKFWTVFPKEKPKIDIPSTLNFDKFLLDF